MARFLFVHTSFPGQFGFLAEALMARGHACKAIASQTAKGMAGVEVRRWSAPRGSTPGLFPPATRAEADMIRGQAAGEAADRLRVDGFAPDIVIGHPGWGETLFLREVFPRARHVAYAEFFYRGTGSDVDFDPEFEVATLHERFRVLAKSATLSLAYAQADVLVAPTRFQASTLPPCFSSDVRVIHEGVETDKVTPRATAGFRLDDGRVLNRTGPVVTYVSRTLEPMRGFHTFMRALPSLLEDVPQAQVLVIGKDDTAGYGSKAPDGLTWKASMLREVGARLDPSRVHFTGPLDRARYLDALAVSAAHVYLTCPFTLSWSLIEAMASGCLVVGSRTPPVMDALDESTGLLVDFFDAAALARAVTAACHEPARFAPLRLAARSVAIARFDRATVCLPAWLRLLRELGAD